MAYRRKRRMRARRAVPSLQTMLMPRRSNAGSMMFRRGGTRL